ncbi:MAG TPA: ATP-binding protein [Nitriliruptorales bacterium]|nr:ATP-binding protein [Nitriliruptorales bacterium]
MSDDVRADSGGGGSQDSGHDAAARGDERTVTRQLSQALDALADVQLELDREHLRRVQTEALLDRLFGSLSDAVLVVDPHGAVTRANAAATQLLGRTMEELLGADAATLYRDRVPATPWGLMEAAPDGQLSLETAVARPDGRGRQVSLSCAIVRDADGKVHGAIHAARDLSQVHRLLREVEAAESRWRLLAHVGAQLADALDPRHALDGIVERLEKDTGCSLAVVLSDEGVIRRVSMSPGAPDGDLLVGLQHTAPPPGTALSRVITGGQTVHAPTVERGFPLIGPGWEQVRSAAVLPLHTETGTVGALVVVSTEPGSVDESTVGLMEEVAARLALSVSNALLRDRLVEHRAREEAARYRNEILAAISHDMKTPLSVLVGLVDTLEGFGESHDPAELQQMRLGLGRQVGRLRRLVVQFLDYIRLEAGLDLSVSPVPTDVRAIVAAVTDSTSASRRVEVDVPDDLPPVLADESRLDLALGNLVSNALKYAPADAPVTITAREAGRNVELSVIDRGPGIPPADQAKLFDKFTRSPDTTGVEGTGLGLYMTRQIMRSQGGDVRVASRPGEGSRFTLVLPRATGEVG